MNTALRPSPSPRPGCPATAQRLVETTFRLDIEGVREYSEADERWEQAVAFLDAGNGAGWDLLKASAAQIND